MSPHVMADSACRASEEDGDRPQPPKRWLVGCAAVLSLLSGGCFFQSIVGWVDDRGGATLSGNLEVGFCNFDTSFPQFYGCTYTIRDDSGGLLDVVSTFELISEFGVFGLVIDPLILQVPDLTQNISGTYNNAGVDLPLVITETNSFPVQSGQTISAEAGTKFMIVELPDAVAEGVGAAGQDFDFQLSFQAPPGPLHVKPMMTARVDHQGTRYYPPIFPCVTDFAAIPSIQIPFGLTFQDLRPALAPLINQASALACDTVTYFFAPGLPGDLDGDTLTDVFETQFGLDPNDPTGDNGATGDPDGDGLTNAEEQTAGTHPRGFFTRFFAEGATAGTLAFETQIATANPGTTAAKVLYRFLKTDGTTVSQFVNLNGMTRHTLDVGAVAGLSNAEFSTVIESDIEVVFDRTMTWDADGYGSHTETSIEDAGLTWNLAEGSTNGFNLFYLIQNANATAANVTVSYLRPGGLAPIMKTYVVGANSRFNIWVNQEDPALAATDLSGVVTSTNNVAVIVERAMYLDLPGQVFGAGHESAGVTTPSTSWFFAEGATGSFFDLFILLSNPNPTASAVRADYLLPDGTVVTKTRNVAPNSRDNIWVDLEDPQLADTAVSTTITVTNGVPIIAERAMWWPATMTPGSWIEAHNSPGSTVTGTQWALAEGEVGGTQDLETFILIANTSAFTGSVDVTLLFEDGTTTTRTFGLTPNSRFNVAVAAEFPGAVGRRFGAVITSQATANGTAQIVVERAMYSDANGVNWAAGTNALATKLQ